MPEKTFVHLGLNCPYIHHFSSSIKAREALAGSMSHSDSSVICINGIGSPQYRCREKIQSRSL